VALENDLHLIVRVGVVERCAFFEAVKTAGYWGRGGGGLSECVREMDGVREMGDYLRRPNIPQKSVFVGYERRFEARLCFFEILHGGHDENLEQGRINLLCVA
jgi:hypothetical protein